MAGHGANLTPENCRLRNEEDPARVRIFDFGAGRKSADIDKSGARRVRAGHEAGLSGNGNTVGNLRRWKTHGRRRGRRGRVRDRVNQRGVGQARGRVRSAERRQIGRSWRLRCSGLLQSLRSAEAIAIARGRLGLLRRTGSKQAAEQTERRQCQRSASHGMKLNRDPKGHQGETESYATSSVFMAWRKWPRIRPSKSALPMMAPANPVMRSRVQRSLAEETPPLEMTGTRTAATIAATA